MQKHTRPSVNARAASTANVADLTAVSTTLDGVTLVEGDVILLKNQTAAAENGLYQVGVVTASSTAPVTRHISLERSNQAVPGFTAFVREGTINAGSEFYLTTSSVTLDTTSLVFKKTPKQLFAPIHMGANWHEVDGTALAAFADGASNTPGLALDNSECAGIRWNNAAAPDPICTSVALPPDLDNSQPLTVHIYASKSGATEADATTFDVGAFFQVVGSLHDADANAGGTSSAMTGDATAKTVQHLTLTIAAADIPSANAGITLTLQPTDGSIDTDDVTVSQMWIDQ
jgi:hypothetical protein